MTSAVIILSLLSALATTGFALLCIDCQSNNSTSCSGSSITCPSGFLCGSTYAEDVIVGTTFNTFSRTCVRSAECNFTGSLSMQDIAKRKGTTCCSTDNCTPTPPELPTKETNLNGLVCPTCSSGDSTWCYTSDTVQCRGNQTMCLLQSTQITGVGSMSIRGCATKSFCDLGNQTLSLEGGTVTYNNTCTNGAPAASTATSTVTTGTTATTTATTATTTTTAKTTKNISNAATVHKVLLTPAIAGFLLLKFYF